MISIVVAYATAFKQIEIPLCVEESCTVALAIKRSGILSHFPEIKWSTIKVGIFGKQVPLDASLQKGDRVEIYHSLIIDPKQARLLRSKNKKSSS